MDKLAAMQTFLLVVDAGTFTRAADLLNMPKSTVTRMVQSLEKDIGVKLLHRTTRQLTLTEDGAIYYEGAVRVLDQIGQLDSSVASSTKAPKGRIKIETPGAIAYNIIVPALPDFFAQYPDVQVDLGVGNRSIDLVAENIDCVVRLGPLLNDSLIARPLGALQMITCASSDYIERHGLPEHPDDLNKDHTLIRIASPRSGREFTDLLTHTNETVSISGKYQLSVNDSTAVLVAALSGLGIATTYAFLVQHHIASGVLHRILPTWEGEHVQAHVAYPVNRHLAFKVRVFVDWTIALFKKIPA